MDTISIEELSADMLHELVTAELLTYEDYRAELDRRAALDAATAASATDHSGGNHG